MDMIEHIITDRLLPDTLIHGYCAGRIFAINAPDGTHCPYIAIKDKITRNEDDVIAMFDISINIYDYDTDKRPMQAVVQRIKDLLNEEMFEDENGIYSNIRVWFNSAEAIEGDDPNLIYMYLSLSARAAENVKNIT
jgi:hypothetical protein